MSGPYDDIMDSRRPAPWRPRMSTHDRAAQFAPFAALRGHDDELAETARLTDAFPELDTQSLATLDGRLAALIETLPTKPWATITKFVADPRKSGGALVTLRVRVRAVDLAQRTLTLVGNQIVNIGDIVAIELETNNNNTKE